MVRPMPRDAPVTATTRSSRRGTRVDYAGMRVWVDKDKCQGHARCYAICPEVYELDDLGFSQTDTIVPPEFEEKAQLAVDSCPEHAILVEK
jgi:ferredoxin